MTNSNHVFMKNRLQDRSVVLNLLLQNIRLDFILSMLPNYIENQLLPLHRKFYSDQNALMPWKDHIIINHNN